MQALNLRCFFRVGHLCPPLAPVWLVNPFPFAHTLMYLIQVQDVNSKVQIILKITSSRTLRLF